MFRLVWAVAVLAAGFAAQAEEKSPYQSAGPVGEIAAVCNHELLTRIERDTCIKHMQAAPEEERKIIRASVQDTVKERQRERERAAETRKPGQ
jgi:hypothetical protein